MCGERVGVVWSEDADLVADEFPKRGKGRFGVSGLAAQPGEGVAGGEGVGVVGSEDADLVGEELLR